MAWQALEARKLPLEDVRFSLISSTVEEYQRLAVYGPKIGVWNQERQFATSEANLKAALDLFKKYGFPTMPAMLGGKREEKIRKPPTPMQRLREITLSLGKVSKTVIQVDRGAQSKEFAGLTNDLFAMYEKDGTTGVTATSLEDALAKMKRGVLAPDLLVLTVNHPQLPPVAKGAAPGWLMHLFGPWADAQTQDQARGLSPQVVRKLSAKQLDRMISVLHEQHFGTLPVNIVDAGYTDVSVSILTFTHFVQARQFGGATASRKSQDQKAIASIREAAHELVRELMPRH